MANRAIRQEPAKSVVAEAVARKMGKAAPKNATKEGNAMVGSNVHPIPGGGIATGAALADQVWNAATDADGRTWVHYFRNLFGLNKEGHEEFRKILRKKRTALNAGERDQGFKTNLSRISEALKVSEAAEKGCTLDSMVEAWNAGEGRTPIKEADLKHPYLVAYCRHYLNAQGSGDNRGRAVVPPARALTEYVLRKYPAKMLHKLAEALQIAAKTVKTDKDREVLLASFKEPKEGEETPKFVKEATTIAKLIPPSKMAVATPKESAAKAQAKEDKARVAKAMAATVH